MLSHLTVSNLAVVEQADVEFAEGLNVLTGETGAGKSVLMGALELVLGGRADTGVIRDGAKEARVEAIFDFAKISSARARALSLVLDDAGVPRLDDDKQLIVRRVLSAAGTSRVWVNDAATTVATLKKIGRMLVDIHGPRANQQVLDERFQRATLDAYGHHTLDPYEQAWRALADIREKIAQLEGTDAREDEIDLLRYQVAECEEANLSDDDETLAERHASAAHAEEILATANEITDALGGETGIAETLIRLQPKFHALAKHLSSAESWASEVEELTVRVQELSRTIADAVSRCEVDPDLLEELDARLTLVNRLKRKYGKGGTIADLLAILATKKERLAELENRDARLDEWRAQEKACEKEVREKGRALTKQRVASAEKLAKAVTKELRDLGFLQAKFSVRIASAEPASHGCDTVAYLFEPNPGETARELAAIASSGEIARVMLAIKTVLAAHDEVDLLVFDEIDANIGGEVGRAVGEKMASVARHRQVIAITHLPQSAVYGRRHLVVAKKVANGRTRTQIASVDANERVAEIVRMLGGEGETNASGVVAKHARELLARAQKM